jgi:argininosuccinate lyase
MEKDLEIKLKEMLDNVDKVNQALLLLASVCQEVTVTLETYRKKIANEDIYSH